MVLLPAVLVWARLLPIGKPFLLPAVRPTTCLAWGNGFVVVQAAGVRRVGEWLEERGGGVSMLPPFTTAALYLHNRGAVVVGYLAYCYGWFRDCQYLYLQALARCWDRVVMVITTTDQHGQS